MDNNGKLARELLSILNSHRRKGNTTALLLSPEVASGRARLIMATQDDAHQFKNDAPKVMSIHRLHRLRGTVEPFVLDNAAVYVVLKDAIDVMDEQGARILKLEKELEKYRPAPVVGIAPQRPLAPTKTKVLVSDTPKKSGVKVAKKVATKPVKTMNGASTRAKVSPKPAKRTAN